MIEILKHQTIRPHDMRRVVLESPYSDRGGLFQVEANVEYARACVHDSLLRGEAPIASHLLYTQPRILDDNDRNERAHGINAGHAWIKAADCLVVYTDHGISEGMQIGIDYANFVRVPVEMRTLVSI